MYLLETLGGLALANGTRAAAFAQRRRLALLALLASVGERGMSRDKVLLYLWPERSGEHGRHALEQLVYEMRRQLGESVFAGTNPLSLNPEVVGSDLDQFDRAFGRGDWEAAVALYRGAFLDGFHLSDAPEFERWVEESRGDIARRYRTSLERLALAADASGQPRRAAEWWRQLVVADPYSTESTLHLMRALLAVGDRSGALERARVHEALVTNELGAAPDPALAALVEEIRRTPGQRVSSPTALPPVVVHAQPADPKPTRTRRRVFAVCLAAIIPGALWLAAGAQNRHATEASSAASSPVLIVPFRVASTDSSLRQLGEGLADLLAARLWGEGGLSVVKPTTTSSAVQSGAAQVLEGEVVRSTGSGLILNATLRSTAGGQVRLIATASGSADSLPRLIDRLAASVLSQMAGEAEWRLPQLAAVPLAVLKTYLAGRAALRRGEYDVAVTRFARAVAADSTFALAGLGLADASGSRFRLRPIEPAISANGWPVEMDSLWSRGIGIGRANLTSLDGRDRDYLDLLAGRQFPNGTTARDHLLAWEEASEAQPDRAEIFAHFGRLLLYQGAAAGIDDARSRALAAFGRARALSPGSVDAIAGLIEIAAFDRDSATLRTLERAYLAVDSVGAMADYVRWRVASVADPSALASVRARFDSLDSETLGRLQWTSQMDGVALEDADRAVEILRRRASTLVERQVACAESAHLNLNGGRPKAALRVLDAGRTLDQQLYCDPVLSIYYNLYWDADTARAAAVAADIRARIAARGDRRADAGELLALAQWDLWHGDTVIAARLLPTMKPLAGETPWLRTRGEILAAILATVEGSPEARRLALVADSTTRLGCCAVSHWADPALIRVWERLGDLPRALQAARRAEWYFAPEYLSSSLRDEARLAARLGDREGSARALAHLLALQARAEPGSR